MNIDFQPNIDITKAFHSTVMTLNNLDNAENGITFVQSGADGPPIHLHPFQEEVFKVYQGKLEVYRQDKWHRLKAGDELIIPKNTPHTFRSRDTDPSYFEYIVTPQGNFTGMLQTFEALMLADKIRSNRDLRSLLYMAMVFKKHEMEIVSVAPPQFVMTTLSAIGKLAGFRL